MKKSATFGTWKYQMNEFTSQRLEYILHHIRLVNAQIKHEPHAHPLFFPLKTTYICQHITSKGDSWLNE